MGFLNCAILVPIFVTDEYCFSVALVAQLVYTYILVQLGVPRWDMHERALVTNVVFVHAPRVGTRLAANTPEQTRERKLETARPVATA